jgi:spore cortex formation protein SpoVR/YcgB (stage V sporulation)
VYASYISQVMLDCHYLNNGELYLQHFFEETEQDLHYLEKVIPYMHKLMLAIYSYDGRAMVK